MIVKVSEWQRPCYAETHNVARQVAELIATIQQEGDPAIERASIEFDGFTPQAISLQPFAAYNIDDRLKQALLVAAANIESFARFQLESMSKVSLENQYGKFAQQVIPLDSMAAYIPAGRFPLISTALMTLIPAKVAGVARRVALCANDSPEMLAAMSLAGATEYIKVGGVQAVAIAALGYQQTEPTSCIVGPGNAYVAEAKKQLSDRIRIDSVAGPSELLVLADSSANLEWIWADICAQAEHDPMAQSLFVSWDQQVCRELASIAQTQGQQSGIGTNQIQILQADDVEQAIAFSNQYAPEHLMLVSDQVETAQLVNYGSLFIGNNSAVAFGDYCAGPNHTLPTLAGAKVKGGLSVFDFVKITTVQQLSDDGRRSLAETASVLADFEGLLAHKASVELRR